MFTTCPNCALNLAVTAADLRIGQGYVRCGRCVSVFNALISLADEAEVAPGEARIDDRAAATQSRPMPADLALLPEDALPPGGAPVVEEESRDMSTGTFETIVLEGDAILQTEEFVDESEVDEQLEAFARQLEGAPAHTFAGAEATGEGGTDAEMALDAALPRRVPDFDADALGEAPPPVVQALDPAEAGAPLPESLRDDAAPAWLPGSRPRRRLTRWMIVAAALALLLGLQAAHHWRQPLADRLPLVARAYAGLGAPLAPQWRVDAYEVRQLGANADPANAARIEVRASVRNAASAPQPAPLLRVVLQDRYGNEISRRELSPTDYLRGTPAPMMDADQRIDASLWVDDPGQKAVGFEIDACLGTADGELHCAADAPLKTASR